MFSWVTSHRLIRPIEYFAGLRASIAPTGVQASTTQSEMAGAIQECHRENMLLKSLYNYKNLNI
jgi:hypothetical protein